MTFSSAISRRVAPVLLHRLRVGMVGIFLAGSLSIAGGMPMAVSAADTIIGTSTHAFAFQHPAEDKVAYLHDGSLLVGFYNGTGAVVVEHVTNPAISPSVVQTETVAGASEVSFYVLPAVSSSEIWIAIGNELAGGSVREEIQYATYNGATVTFGTVYAIPGGLTPGRQDPTVTWDGKDLIVSWWDDTQLGNSDTVFMNWTTDKTGSTGWLTAKTGTTTSLLTGMNGTTAAATTLAAAKSGTTARSE